ncbi:PREDICTED: transcription factor E4F1-like [Priapulus caudatus]|uniref:Transcription factor E4F1-like n=1 Tax=Priapulus caudatus TaxID=37621 RepID=A0ABM1DRA1_PRICU|nr:PREDICTED: transcription factor E4F1-like [Priapulus caudatus]
MLRNNSAAYGLPTASVDTFHCSKCDITFTNLEDYFHHKITVDECKLLLTPSGKLQDVVIPLLLAPPSADTPYGFITEEQEGLRNDADASQAAGSKLCSEASNNAQGTEPSASNKWLYFECIRCTTKFHDSAELQEHLKVCQVDKPTSSNQPTDGEQLNDSCKEAEGLIDPCIPDERSYACQTCGQTFGKLQTLKAHSKVHLDVYEYPCIHPGCPFQFKLKGSLKRHMRRHTGERPFVCKLCGRSFSESGALTRHMKSQVVCTVKADGELPRYGKRLPIRSEYDTSDGPDHMLVVPKRDVKRNIKMEVLATENVSGDAEEERHYRDLEATEADGDSVVSAVWPSAPDHSVSAGVQSNSQNEQNPASAPVLHSTEDGVVEVECPDEIDYEDAAVESGPGVILMETVEQTEEEHNLLKCWACNEIQTDEVQLKSHLKLHIGNRTCHCGQCHFITTTQDLLAAHMIARHGRTLINAKVTTKLEKSLQAGAIGSRLEHIEERQEDLVAEKAAEQLRQLDHDSPSLLEKQDNSLASNSGFKATHKCGICGRVFRGRSYLRMHLKRHSGEKPHLCGVCGKRFVARDSLKKHLVMHSDARHYKCGECGKLYKRINHVREHLRVHTECRPYDCTHCGKKFKCNSALKVHLRTHVDVFPYVCPHCGRRFREKASLERHTRSHTGEKPFPCKYCGRCFTEHGSLNRHLRAKVPCYSAEQLQTEGVDLIACDQQNMDAEAMATVLAEFSSMVADTQHYIIQTANGSEVATASTSEGSQMQDDQIFIITDPETATTGDATATGHEVIIDPSESSSDVVMNAELCSPMQTNIAQHVLKQTEVAEFITSSIGNTITTAST